SASHIDTSNISWVDTGGIIWNSSSIFRCLGTIQVRPMMRSTQTMPARRVVIPAHVSAASERGALCSRFSEFGALIFHLTRVQWLNDDYLSVSQLVTIHPSNSAADLSSCRSARRRRSCRLRVRE